MNLLVAASILHFSEKKTMQMITKLSQEVVGIISPLSIHTGNLSKC